MRELATKIVQFITLLETRIRYTSRVTQVTAYYCGAGHGGVPVDIPGSPNRKALILHAEDVTSIAQVTIVGMPVPIIIQQSLQFNPLVLDYETYGALVYNNMTIEAPSALNFVALDIQYA